MKIKRLLFYALLTGMLSLFSAGNAHATALGFNAADIFWDTLSITGIPIAFTSQTSHSRAFAEDDLVGPVFQEQILPGWVDTDAFAGAVASFGTSEKPSRLMSF
jgi:hypothetical protein